jgi:hypothetical protein
MMGMTRLIKRALLSMSSSIVGTNLGWPAEVPVLDKIYHTISLIEFNMLMEHIDRNSQQAHVRIEIVDRMILMFGWTVLGTFLPQ